MLVLLLAVPLFVQYHCITIVNILTMIFTILITNFLMYNSHILVVIWDYRRDYHY